MAFASVPPPAMAMPGQPDRDLGGESDGGGVLVVTLHGNFDVISDHFVARFSSFTPPHTRRVRCSS